MAIAAKKTSQVLVHMAIAFAITYALTGSVVVGGLAILVEALINAMLLPLHEQAWTVFRTRISWTNAPCLAAGAEKLSQTALHMAVAFAVMYVATGSLAFGGLAAVLEPACNVTVLPFHDRFWNHLLVRATPAPTRV